jgi:hypothetical protein
MTADFMIETSQFETHNFDIRINGKVRMENGIETAKIVIETKFVAIYRARLLR